MGSSTAVSSTAAFRIARARRGQGKAVAGVCAGDAVFSPRLARFVLDAFTSSAPAPPGSDPEVEQLTGREQEVLRLIAGGYAYKAVARELSIPARPVQTHGSNRHELSRWAAERRPI